MWVNNANTVSLLSGGGGGGRKMLYYYTEGITGTWGHQGTFRAASCGTSKQPMGLLGSQAWVQGRVFPWCNCELFQRPKSSQEGLTACVVEWIHGGKTFSYVGHEVSLQVLHQEVFRLLLVGLAGLRVLPGLFQAPGRDQGAAGQETHFSSSLRVAEDLSRPRGWAGPTGWGSSQAPQTLRAVVWVEVSCSGSDSG